jgi:hypothetical protein
MVGQHGDLGVYRNLRSRVSSQRLAGAEGDVGDDGMGRVKEGTYAHTVWVDLLLCFEGLCDVHALIPLQRGRPASAASIDEPLPRPRERAGVVSDWEGLRIGAAGTSAEPPLSLHTAFRWVV